MSYLSEQNKCGFKIDDLVLVTRKAFSHEKEWKNSWNPTMDNMVGKICKITNIGGITGIKLTDGIHDIFYFPYFVLKKQNMELIRKQEMEEME